jgi:hypothetical protein
MVVCTRLEVAIRHQFGHRCYTAVSWKPLDAPSATELVRDVFDSKEEEMTMFEAIRKLFRRKRDGFAPVPEPAVVLVEPATKPVEPVPLPTEPAPEDVHASWRPNRLYLNRSEQQRAYRERLALRKASAAAKEPIAPVPAVAPASIEPVIGAPSDIPANSQHDPTERSKPTSIPWAALRSLIMPGPHAAPVPAPPAQPIVAPIVESEPVVPEPAPTMEPAACFPNWDDERRTDLPPRSPEQIRGLLEFETAVQTRARIGNDKARYMNQRGSRVFSSANPQNVIIPSSAKYPGKPTWIRR